MILARHHKREPVSKKWQQLSYNYDKKKSFPLYSQSLIISAK